MNSLYGSFRQIKFSDVWDEVDEFLEDYEDNGVPTSITTTSATTLYYLLLSKYANSTIASSDINQFKLKVFATIFQFGPTWEKRLDVQKKLRELTDSDLEEGSTAIHNHAFHPATEPTTQTTEELSYIDEQNTTKYKKGKLDKYAMLWELLDTDVTGYFLKQFEKLFLKVVYPEAPLYYITETEEEDND